MANTWPASVSAQALRPQVPGFFSRMDACITMIGTMPARQAPHHGIRSKGWRPRNAGYCWHWRAWPLRAPAWRRARPGRRCPLFRRGRSGSWCRSRPAAEPTTRRATLASGSPRKRGRRGGAEGYPLLLASTSPLAVNPLVIKALGYDPVKDYKPLSGLARSMNAIVVANDSPLATLEALLAAAKAGPLTVGTYSAGYHLAAAWLAQLAGCTFSNVPYKGQAPIMTPLIRPQT